MGESTQLAGRTADELGYDARLLEALYAALEQEDEGWRITRRLIAIANAADTDERDRAGAIALLTQLPDRSFLGARMREHYGMRYLHEFSGRYALVPEHVQRPTALDAVPDAVAEAGRVQLFVHRGSELREVDYFDYSSRMYGLKSGFESFIKRLPLDYRRQTEWLQHLYDASRFSPRVPSDHPNEFLRMLAMRRRTLLQLSRSTLLFIQVNDKQLHELPMWCHGNAAYEIQLEQMSAADPRREVMMASLARGEQPWIPDPDTANARRLSRRIVAEDEAALLVADTRCWFKQTGCTLWTGPRDRDPRRSDELRYFALERMPEKWAMVMLDGSPYRDAELRFNLSFEPTDDLRDMAELSFGDAEAVEKTQLVPSVSVFWGARDLPTTDTLALTFTADHAALGTLQIESTQRLPLDLPRRGEFPVLIRREADRIVLEAAGQRLAFDTPPACLGFAGIVVQGAGFARLGHPQLRKPQ